MFVRKLNLDLKKSYCIQFQNFLEVCRCSLFSHTNIELILFVQGNHREPTSVPGSSIAKPAEIKLREIMEHI